MSTKVIYPGTFDPVTFGHLDLINRASKIFDEVIVAVAHNTTKQPLFSDQERLEMLTEATKDIEGISIQIFDGLVIDFARKNDVHVLSLIHISEPTRPY